MAEQQHTEALRQGTALALKLLAAYFFFYISGKGHGSTSIDNYQLLIVNYNDFWLEVNVLLTVHLGTDTGEEIAKI